MSIKTRIIVIFSIGILILSIVMSNVGILYESATADVGNSFSSGKSSNSSLYDGYSSRGGGKGFIIIYLLTTIFRILPFPLNIILIIGLLIVVNIGRKWSVSKVSNRRNNTRDISAEYKGDYNSPGYESEYEVTTKIQAIDPEFSKYEFKSYVESVYIRTQEAWEEKECKVIRPFTSNEFFEKCDNQIKEYIEKGWTMHLDGQEVKNVTLVKFELDGNFEILIANLDASVFDYTTEDSTGKVVNGDKNRRYNRIYELRFKRAKGVKSKSGEIQKSVTNCPNCGAPTHVTSSGACDYCGSVITTGDYGWVLDSYKGIRQY